MRSARSLAVEALTRIGNNARPKEELESLGADLSVRDRAFLNELVYGSLRHRMLIEWILDRFLDRPEDLLDKARSNLIIAMYQLIYLRVPDHAAVNEAVELEGRLRGLVNAVLRNFLRKRDTIMSELASMERSLNASRITRIKGAELVMAAGLTTSHPDWLVERWLKRFGPEDAVALMKANNDIPSLTLRVNTLKTTTDDLLDQLRSMDIEAEATSRSPVGIRLAGTLAFRELEPLSGLVMAQDEAAQLVSLMLDLKEGDRVLDACAAPGGKAGHMAELTRDLGEIVAVESDKKRTTLLRENMLKMGYKSVSVLNSDVMEMAETEPFDAVMVDAPCSSLGVVRRNPDIKLRRKENELAGYARRQLKILSASALMVRPGGKLLYCTCSTEPEEGEGVVREFLRQRSDFYIIEDVPVPGVVLKEGVFRSFPHTDGIDGFFAIRMDRQK